MSVAQDLGTPQDVRTFQNSTALQDKRVSQDSKVPQDSRAPQNLKGIGASPMPLEPRGQLPCPSLAVPSSSSVASPVGGIS